MPPRFVADSMLGKLARWLRALGFDAVYHPFAEDAQVVAWARERGAVLLTRDTGLAKVQGVQIIFIEHNQVGDQLRQVVREAGLDLKEAQPLTRCTMCNESLVPAERNAVWDRVPPFIYLTQERYARCPGCGRVYWEGTHVERMRDRLAELARSAGQGDR